MQLLERTPPWRITPSPLKIGGRGQGHGCSRRGRLPRPSEDRRNPILDHRVNDDIRISPVRLIDPDGEQIGVVSLDKAREEADDRDLDLVEVAPDARPPVVKIMDWGKYRYEQQKKAQEARRSQHQTEVKEIQLRPRTDDHDFQVKLRRARKFLEQGNMVRVVVRFRGRELRRPEVGHNMMDQMIEATDDIASVEHRANRIEGRRLQAMLEPDLH